MGCWREVDVLIGQRAQSSFRGVRFRYHQQADPERMQRQRKPLHLPDEGKPNQLHYGCKASHIIYKTYDVSWVAHLRARVMRQVAVVKADIKARVAAKKNGCEPFSAVQRPCDQRPCFDINQTMQKSRQLQHRTASNHYPECKASNASARQIRCLRASRYSSAQLGEIVNFVCHADTQSPFHRNALQ